MSYTNIIMQINMEIYTSIHKNRYQTQLLQQFQRNAKKSQQQQTNKN